MKERRMVDNSLNFCPSCGNKLNSGVELCHCGLDIESYKNENEAASGDEKPQNTIGEIDSTEAEEVAEDGSDAVAEDKVPSSSQEESSSAEQKKSRLPLIAAIAGVVVVGIVAAVLLLGQTSDESTGEPPVIIDIPELGLSETEVVPESELAVEPESPAPEPVGSEFTNYAFMGGQPSAIRLGIVEFHDAIDINAAILFTSETEFEVYSIVMGADEIPAPIGFNDTEIYIGHGHIETRGEYVTFIYAINFDEVGAYEFMELIQDGTEYRFEMTEDTPGYLYELTLTGDGQIMHFDFALNQDPEFIRMRDGL
ncbi:MAG: zinc ribbon domain-containing protein [Coriobacteriia bacterium]|nr:zinc ribbon domain-containing protein [Coriobacteriia bacterium]